jgi:hypothetical protein
MFRGGVGVDQAHTRVHPGSAHTRSHGCTGLYDEPLRVRRWAAAPTGPQAAGGRNTPKSPEHRQIGRDIDLINLK